MKASCARRKEEKKSGTSIIEGRAGAETTVTRSSRNALGLPSLSRQLSFSGAFSSLSKSAFSSSIESR